jgi:hypothetical protein
VQSPLQTSGNTCRCQARSSTLIHLLGPHFDDRLNLLQMHRVLCMTFTEDDNVNNITQGKGTSLRVLSMIVTLAEWQWLYCSNAIGIQSGNNVSQASAMELQSALFQKLGIVLFSPFPPIKSQSADWYYLNLTTQKCAIEHTRPNR